MKHFKQMIDVIRTHGVVSYVNGTAQTSETVATERLYEAIEECQPFVFWTDSLEVSEDESIKASIDAPFRVFSIELLDGYLFETNLPEGGAIKFSCVLVVEDDQQRYHSFALHQFPDGTLRVLQAGLSNSKVTRLINQYLKLIERQELGLEKPRLTVKVGSGKSKRTHRIRKIIHVAPKRMINSTSNSHRHVDWSHRFSIRGHWRTLTKGARLGKDRNGDYCIHGKTWVVDHERGPEDMPLVKKVRVIHNQPTA